VRKYILAFVLVGICPLLVAQQALDNDSVVKLVKSGLSEDVIVSTIGGSAGNYDKSAAGLAALKDAGASDKIIAAIQAKPSAAASPTASTPAAAKSTVYIYRPGRFKGAAGYWLLFSSGDYLGEMTNATYVKTEAPAGSWELSGLGRVKSILIGYALLAKLSKNAKELHRMTVEAGKTYYLRMDLAFSGPKFVSVDQATAEKDMRKCHLAKNATGK
jgi:hypothetical protein